MSPQSHPDRRPRPPAGYPLPPLSLFSVELSRNLRVDSVSRLMPAPPHAVDAREAVSAAVATMRRERTGCVLVTRAGRLVGIFTDRDLIVRVLGPDLPLSTPVAECLTPRPVTIRPKDTVHAAVRRMEEGGYRHLPVVDEADRPVGILSARRVVHYLVEHFPALVYNQPPDPNRVPEQADGA